VQSTRIFRFAAGEQAPQRLSLKCEPIVVPRGTTTGLEAAVPLSKGKKKQTID